MQQHNVSIFINLTSTTQDTDSCFPDNKSSQHDTSWNGIYFMAYFTECTCYLSIYQGWNFYLKISLLFINYTG